MARAILEGGVLINESALNKEVRYEQIFKILAHLKKKSNRHQTHLSDKSKLKSKLSPGRASTKR